jgi:hypothetical protein
MKMVKIWKAEINWGQLQRHHDRGNSLQHKRMRLAATASTNARID